MPGREEGHGDVGGGAGGVGLRTRGRWVGWWSIHTYTDTCVYVVYVTRGIKGRVAPQTYMPMRTYTCAHRLTVHMNTYTLT
eukprot:40195-Eustigmatos_ZCMA.PRE.1